MRSEWCNAHDAALWKMVELQQQQQQQIRHFLLKPSSSLASPSPPSSPPRCGAMATAGPHLRFATDQDATIAGYHTWIDLKFMLPN